MQRGCRLNDYSAMVGASGCSNVALTDNKFVFSPPLAEPSKLPNDTFCSECTLPVTVFSFIITVMSRPVRRNILAYGRRLRVIIGMALDAVV